MSESYYDLLEVNVNASFEEIESSYQRIVSYLDTSSLAIYSMMEEDEVARMRSAVDEAFRTLSDPERRAAYDRALSEGDDYFSVTVPDMHTDSSISIGHVDSEPRERAPEHRASERSDTERMRSEQPDAERMRSEQPDAERMRSEQRDAERMRSEQWDAERIRAERDAERMRSERDAERMRSEQRDEERARPPGKPKSKVRRLRPTLEIEVGPDTEFSGSLLRRVRESADATLEDLGEITKISKRYLHAIEENDFSALPASVYVRGFVSEYARALGLDPQAVAKSYMALYQRYKKEGA